MRIQSWVKDHQHELYRHTKRSSREKDSRICMYVQRNGLAVAEWRWQQPLPQEQQHSFPPSFSLRTGVPTSSPSHCSKLASVGSATAQLSVPGNGVSHSSQSAQCSTFFSFWMTSVFRLCLQRKKSYYFCSKSSFFNVISITIRLDELDLLSILQILSISKMISCPRQNPNSSTWLSPYQHLCSCSIFI